MIHLKYCKNPKCQAPFDMGVGDYCPNCRGEDFEVQEELKDDTKS